MILSDAVLGRHATKKITAGQHAVLLEIGSDRFSRHDLAAIDCFHFTAAANLSALLKQHLPTVKNTTDLFERIPPAALAVPRLGVLSLAIVGAAFELKKVGGSVPLEAWCRQHQDKSASIVTFQTMKKADQQERTAEQKERQRRKATRRNQAHRVRVDRFQSRQESGMH